MNIYKQAIKSSIRFSHAAIGGSLTPEQLWDLSLNKLDDIFKSLNKELKIDSEESFLEIAKGADPALLLKLEIVKDVMTDKIAAKAKSSRAKERKEQRAKIMAVIAEKEDGIRGKRSLKSLYAELEDLEAED